MRASFPLPVIASLLLATPAVADDLAPPTYGPGFTTLLRQDAQSRAGADLTYFVIDGDNPNDVRLLRLDLHGQFVDAGSGFGGYGQIPITFLSSDSNDETTLGNVELGMIFVPKLSTPDFGLVMRGGLILPTGPDTGFLDSEAFVNALATSFRITDLYSIIPDATSLRLAVSPMFRGGTFFARADLGVDINISDGDTNTDPDPGLLLNFGAGVNLGGAALMGELATYQIMEDNEDSLTTLAISVRGTGPVQPYGALVVPLDDGISEEFDFGLVFGVEARMR